ncbi:unnamed protein product [Dicrocoelium dendriticum]|nr:unnamed protein product [Dicrocoelium dendriticum]
MQTAVFVCFLNCLLGASSKFLSVTVAEDARPYNDFMNETIGTNVESYCRNQRLDLNQTSYGTCVVYKWFYEPRTKELACVCEMNDTTDRNVLLWQGNLNSRAIPAILKKNFTEAYILRIWTELDPLQTAHDLFSSAANNDVELEEPICEKLSNQINAYECGTLHCNTEHVSWEYPENWIGPVRYLRNITYNQDNISVQIVGMYWPVKHSVGSVKQFHVDTTMLVEAGQTDACNIFFTKLVIWLMPIPKCHEEFREESVDNPPQHLARLNLLLNLEVDENSTMEAIALNLATFSKPWGRSCVSPFQIRPEKDYYVPSRMIENGKLFEFRVTFSASVLHKKLRESMGELAVCNRLKEFSNYTLKNCKVIERKANYGIASVSINSTKYSVWEAQLQLMGQLNSRNPNYCYFNVETTKIFKGY